MKSDKPGFRDIGFAKVDIDRHRRRGFPEVIFCQGKTAGQIKAIAEEILRDKQPLLLTRIAEDTFVYLKRQFPKLNYNKEARAAYYIAVKKKKRGPAVIVTAGTSDIPVAEEARVTLELSGVKAKRIYDCGVAGLHRIRPYIGSLRRAKVIIVVAGMEGALASIVSGMVSCPVIAVPTSVGYGSSFKGLSALLTMLNSCSPGVAVMNIDNGFGAGYFAGLIA
ncbi:MAG: nickel pincer cofactor biosynthesis protein LarB [Candidatus Omnitrophica bacterium]|nr:nickel pincer cofactor biosynthesis protein LarB [Candidatus Omnitrophota bacterium]